MQNLSHILTAANPEYNEEALETRIMHLIYCPTNRSEGDLVEVEKIFKANKTGYQSISTKEGLVTPRYQKLPRHYLDILAMIWTSLSRNLWVHFSLLILDWELRQLQLRKISFAHVNDVIFAKTLTWGDLTEVQVECYLSTFQSLPLDSTNFKDLFISSFLQFSVKRNPFSNRKSKLIIEIPQISNVFNRLKRIIVKVLQIRSLPSFQRISAS